MPFSAPHFPSATPPLSFSLFSSCVLFLASLHTRRRRRLFPLFVPSLTILAKHYITPFPGPARSPLSLSPVPSSEGYTKLCDYMRLLPFVSFSSCSQWQKLWPENVHLHMTTHTHTQFYIFNRCCCCCCLHSLVEASS